MYISREYDTKDKEKEYIRSILIEQDEESPHVYLKDGFQVPYGSTVVCELENLGNLNENWQSSVLR